MSRTLDEVNREIARIRSLPYGVARTQAAELQARLVEAEGPDQARAYALSVLVESMVWAGEVDRAYLPFTRLVRWWDEHPEHFDEVDKHAMFWSFKWMVGHLGDFPTVPAAQIEATLDDMERRYALAGLGRDAVAYSRFAWAARRGAADVEERYDAWVATPRDEYSQCEVCDPGDRASYLFETGRTTEGARLVEETLDRGLTCATEPADMLAGLALAYLDLGRPADAVRTHRRAVAALAETSSDMAAARGERIELLGRAGHPARLVRAVEQDQRLLLEADTPRARLDLLLGVVAGTAALLPAHADVAVRLADVPAATLGALHAWAAAQARTLADAFDARNGSTRMSRMLADALATQGVAEPLDLDVVRLPAAPAEDASVAGTTPGVLPDGPVAAAAAGASATGEPALARAERLLSAGDTEGAAQAYVEAAGHAEAAGLLVDAGYALAEAAACAQVLGDEDTSARLFERGAARLRAGGADPVDLVPVLVAWAPAAGTTGEVDPFLAAVDATRATLVEEPEADASPEQAALAERRKGDRRRALADVDDAAARVLATTGGEERLQDAVVRAGRAAEAYAGVGAVADAAHAFWLAGRLLDALDRTEDAAWHLESAVEGFGVARAREPRTQAADDLVALLRRTGHDDRAEEILRSLTR
ncbi:hypothetical protein [Cellulomonas oligotrophica]|uniref:Tetratricopeptide (TPR) repeat protein n=1 Tax=Cellulomonas oligotrophica TaxID=931536 RepID=A0A7Y9JXA4_9CELL|nr:hypothetical protein [Cellulomonas oligotrophica]NYD86493.1 tetratricopeptide (TPR) repeat protein [Cellulomonas oligotrophica]GIG32616.1 hypothetical protein Col01nite_17750 [Cellulomonas oligotrophica]